MSFLAELAEKKGQGWLKPITHAHQILSGQGLSNREFVELIEACQTSEQVSLLAREFFRFSQTDGQKRSGYQVFIKEVDDSDYELADWIRSVEIVFNWLQDNRKTCDFATIVNYLNCCSQSPDHHLFHHELTAMAQQMLAEHGMELAENIDPGATS